MMRLQSNIYYGVEVELETDKQRRWWFANHPEYGSSRTGHRHSATSEDDRQGDKVSPHEVDEYVDYALQHVDGPLAVFLQSIKRNFGTEASSSMAVRSPVFFVQGSGSESHGEEDDQTDQEGSFGSSYGWGKDNWDESLNLALSYLFPGLAGTTNVRKAIRTLEKQMRIHENKLADYIKNPDLEDHKGLLKNADEARRQSIIQGRIKHLQKEIQNCRDAIQRLQGGLK